MLAVVEVARPYVGPAAFQGEVPEVARRALEDLYVEIVERRVPVFHPVLDAGDSQLVAFDLWQEDPQPGGIDYEVVAPQLLFAPDPRAVADIVPPAHLLEEAVLVEAD